MFCSLSPSAGSHCWFSETDTGIWAKTWLQIKWRHTRGCFRNGGGGVIAFSSTGKSFQGKLGGKKVSIPPCLSWFLLTTHNGKAKNGKLGEKKKSWQHFYDSASNLLRYPGRQLLTYISIMWDGSQNWNLLSKQLSLNSRGRQCNLKEIQILGLSDWYSPETSSFSSYVVRCVPSILSVVLGAVVWIAR